MNTIILKKFCPACYSSEFVYLEHFEDWKNKLKTFFAERVANDPTITSRRIQLFINTLEELDANTAKKKFWLQLIQFMVMNDIHTIECDKWEIIYFLKECLPIKFKFQVSRTIYDHDFDHGITDAELDKIIETGKIENPLDKEFPDIKENGWDLNLILMFSQEDVEKTLSDIVLPENIMEILKEDAYTIDVFFLKQTSLKTINTTLLEWNVKIDESIF